MLNTTWHAPPQLTLCKAGRNAAFKGRKRNFSCSAKQTSEQETDNASRGPSFDPQDPAQVVAWGGRLPSRRRAITGFLSGLGIVLVSNLGGSTGALLSLDGGRLAGKLHLDVLYPVSGFKRCLDGQNGFEFIFPATWLADQRMYKRNAERGESLRGLDPPSIRPQRRNVAEPVAAFGPPGSSGELNVSVIVAPIEESFTLASLGEPREAGAKFLSTIAPEGSSLTATLLDASERKDESGEVYYYLEYTVERPGNFFRHNVSTYAARYGNLYTLNAQCAETSWQANKEALRKTAASFKVASSRPASKLTPGRRQPPADALI